jgi:hypothetical protein
MSILGCTSALLLSSIVAERRLATGLARNAALRRHRFAASRTTRFAAAFECRRIALPWSRRGIIAGHTSLPEAPHSGAGGRAQHWGVSSDIDSRDFKLEDVIKFGDEPG